MYTDPLQFTLSIVCSVKNLEVVLESLQYSLCRRNMTLENELPQTHGQKMWWFILAQKVELECTIVEDLINNYEQIRELI